ncbi:MAG: hypothetical protein ACI80S_002091, partial [Pseudohongiellaceae bacterium]
WSQSNQYKQVADVPLFMQAFTETFLRRWVTQQG